MWLISLPAGLILLLLNRWIPESPRFLLQRGREEEARQIMQRYGASLVEDDEPDAAKLGAESWVEDRFRQVFAGRFLALGACVLLLGISIGLSQYGFQQWMPSNLQRLGYSSIKASSILRDSALYGLPLSVPIACLYGLWSSRKTVILILVVNVIAMMGFVLGGGGLVRNHALLEAFLIIPTWSIGLMASVLAIYAAEVYPTKIRSRGSGLAAGLTAQ